MFKTDGRTESFLEQMGVIFRYSNNVKYADLHPKWDTTNTARPVPVREEAVINYAKLMEDGSAAPAPILSESNFVTTGSLTVLDGVQRLEAARLNGESLISAYLVQSDSEDVLAAIGVLANPRLQGYAESPEYNIRNAVQQLVIGRGMSAAQVAAMGGWQASDINRLHRILEYGFQIRCIGGPQKLPDVIVKHVADVTSVDNLRAASKPIASFLRGIKDTKFSAADALPYITEFFQPAPPPKKAVEVYSRRLAEFKDDREVKVRLLGRKRTKLQLDVRLRREMRSAVNLIDEAISTGEPLPNTDEFLKLAKSMIAKLKSISPHCPVKSEPRVPADKWSKHDDE